MNKMKVSQTEKPILKEQARLLKNCGGLGRN